MPIPLPPAISHDCGLVAAIQMRGCGFWSGFGGLLRGGPGRVGELDLLERLVIAAILAALVVRLRRLQLVEEVEFHTWPYAPAGRGPASGGLRARAAPGTAAPRR